MIRAECKSTYYLMARDANIYYYLRAESCNAGSIRGTAVVFFIPFSFYLFIFHNHTQTGMCFGRDIKKNARALDLKRNENCRNDLRYLVAGSCGYTACHF